MRWLLKRGCALSAGLPAKDLTAFFLLMNRIHKAVGAGAQESGVPF